jgi:hypothetical protein
MSTSMVSYRAQTEGQIALERALFCLECELIFAGTAFCPRCAGKAVWPLADWVRPARLSTAIVNEEDDLVGLSHAEKPSQI